MYIVISSVRLLGLVLLFAAAAYPAFGQSKGNTEKNLVVSESEAVATPSRLQFESSGTFGLQSNSAMINPREYNQRGMKVTPYWSFKVETPVFTENIQMRAGVKASVGMKSSNMFQSLDNLSLGAQTMVHPDITGYHLGLRMFAPQKWCDRGLSQWLDCENLQLGIDAYHQSDHYNQSLISAPGNEPHIITHPAYRGNKSNPTSTNTLGFVYKNRAHDSTVLAGYANVVAGADGPATIMGLDMMMPASVGADGLLVMVEKQFKINVGQQAGNKRKQTINFTAHSMAVVQIGGRESMDQQNQEMRDNMVPTNPWEDDDIWFPNEIQRPTVHGVDSPYQRLQGATCFNAEGYDYDNLYRLFNVEYENAVAETDIYDPSNVQFFGTCFENNVRFVNNASFVAGHLRVGYKTENKLTRIELNLDALIAVPLIKNQADIPSLTAQTYPDSGYVPSENVRFRDKMSSAGSFTITIMPVQYSR